jgi:RNA polymerase sigma-70 factor (ECF subfamily)
VTSSQPLGDSAGRPGVEAIAERTLANCDRDTFAEFVRPHWDVMAALARRLAPPGQDEDALQDALAAAWRKRSQFDPSRGAARSWLLAIVADQAYKGRRRLRPTEDLVDVAAESVDREVDVDLRAALLRLTERQRTAVALHYYLGLPVAEVAIVLACSAGTVKSTLADARTRLRSLLGEDYR